MLRKKDEELKKDKRIAEMYKRLGKKIPVDYEKDLKSLPDSSSDFEYIDLDEVDETIEEVTEVDD